MGRSRSALMFFALISSVPLTVAQSIAIVPGKVDDTRLWYNGDSREYGSLRIELKLTGNDVADVKALRLTVKSARDDHGTTLLKPDYNLENPACRCPEPPPEFKEFPISQPAVELRNPARGASFVEVEGTVDLFIPTKHANATQKIEAFQSHLDTPLANAALAQAKVEITPLSLAGWKSRATPRSREEIIAEGKRRGASKEEVEQRIQAARDLASLAAGFQPGVTSVVFELKDPERRVFGVQVVGSDGHQLGAITGWSETGGLKMSRLDLEQRAPANAALLVTIRTPESTVSIPFSWKRVVLP